MDAISVDSCFKPFINIEDFPFKGGFEEGRRCAPVGNVTCCLPCPLSDWVYPDNFNVLSEIATYVALFSFVCCVFLLVSFIVLPVVYTSRHYLTIGVIAALAILDLSFVVALGASPDQCYDKITPNDMGSNLPCAFSGAFVLFGGLSGVMWVFIRSLSLHLQICWKIVPGKKFFWGSMFGGWCVPIVLLAVSLAFSGVSYRFGTICHINHDKGIESFWGPLLTFAGLATILQLLTFVYCLHVYLRSVMDNAAVTSGTSSTLPSSHGSTMAMSPRAAYRRIRKVIALQWRGIMVVVVVICSVVYFAIIFLRLDTQTSAEAADPKSALPWLQCLVANQGDKNKCLDLAQKLVIPEPPVVAVLFMIAGLGFLGTLFMGRLSVFKGWWDLFGKCFRRKNRDFVSYDAKRMSDPANYEMLTSPPQQFHMVKGPDGLVATSTLITSPEIVYRNESAMSPMSPESDYANDKFPARSPSVNYSHPMSPPSRSGSQAGRVSFRTETPTTPPPPKEWSASPVMAMSPPPPSHYGRSEGAFPVASSIYSARGSSAQGQYERTASMRAYSQERSSAALGREWSTGNVSPQLRRHGSYRSNEAPYRDWDPRSTFARPNRALSPAEQGGAGWE